MNYQIDLNGKFSKSTSCLGKRFGPFIVLSFTGKGIRVNKEYIVKCCRCEKSFIKSLRSLLKAAQINSDSCVRCRYGVIKYKKRKYTISDLSEKFGIDKQTLYLRLKAGWSVDRALNESCEREKKYDFNGENLTIEEASNRFQLPATTIQSRLFQGITGQDLICKKKENKEKRQRIICIGTKKKNVKDWCLFYGVSPATFYYRIKKGMSPKEALIS